ncbi:hypothetical protein KTD31_00480 [Burkholderia multivorans]|uniref:hypothetical protein n=1 Tax=Burkholderia multivorans TaxID=87883 RepID=UPI001C22406A|nr:hypothetical protein [Burkholderia multivorans]MBU9199875.1 hypothetical protein [Burkholderia multivorans]MDN8079006.1 hypothetical protein [Burkholderia multivorans]
MRLRNPLILAALLVSSAAHAQFLDRVDLPPAIVTGFVSHHIDVHKHYNELNYGLGYRFGSPNVIVGYYRNSDYRNSFYAAYEAQWKLTKYVRAGIVAGGVTGYGIPVMPLVLPELALQVKGFELVATYAPKVSHYNPALVALQARWSWKH